MINLLPPDYRLRQRYGRINRRQVRWIEIGLLLIAVLILILGAGWLYMDKQTKDLNRSTAATKRQLEVQNLTKVQAQADQISQNVRIINQVLSRELRFSDLITEIGKVMPPGAVLNSLTLSNKVSGALDLSANAKNYTSAAQIAVNLSDPKNNIFAKVDIINVNCSTTSAAYPCSVSLRALFDKNVPQRFLNIASGGIGQ